MVDNQQLLDEKNIPWESICSLGTLTFLIYDFMKNWDFTKLTELNDFIQNEEQNDKLCEKDISLLRGLKEKYPQGELVKFFTNSTDLQCAVCKSETHKKFAIVFRGSESLLDWLYDFMVWKTKFTYNDKTYGYVHAGFYNQIMKNNFFTQLCSLVEEQISKHNDYEWEITGHSAGGAHSILTSFLLAQCFPNKHFTCTSLAAPRVGNYEFQQLFEKTVNLTHYRVCYNRDVITSVPTIGYYHTGICLLYINNAWDVDSKCSFYIYRCWSIKDHSVDKYVNALTQQTKH